MLGLQVRLEILVKEGLRGEEAEFAEQTTTGIHYFYLCDIEKYYIIIIH